MLNICLRFYYMKRILILTWDEEFILINAKQKQDIGEQNINKSFETNKNISCGQHKLTDKSKYTNILTLINVMGELPVNRFLQGIGPINKKRKYEVS